MNEKQIEEAYRHSREAERNSVAPITAEPRHIKIYDAVQRLEEVTCALSSLLACIDGAPSPEIPEVTKTQANKPCLTEVLNSVADECHQRRQDALELIENITNRIL